VDGSSHFDFEPFSRDGGRFITRKADSLRVWDTRTLQPVSDWLRHEGLQYCRLSADGKTIFTAARTEVVLWDVATSKRRRTTKVTDDALRFADSSPDASRFLVVEDRTGALSIWRSEDGVRAVTLPANAGLISAEFDTTGVWVVAHEYQKGFRVISASNGQQELPFLKSDDDCWAPFRSQIDRSGRQLALPREDGFVVLDLTAGGPAIEVKLPPSLHTDNIRFSPDGTKVAIVTWQFLRPGPVQVYDVNSGRLDREFGASIVQCRISTGNRLALCATRKNNVDYPEVWDISNGQKLQTFAEPRDTKIAMDPTGSLFLLATSDSTTVWRMTVVSRSTRP
jgi:WD40 repeat protein